MPGCLHPAVGPFPFKNFKKHSLFFVPGVPAAGILSQVLLSCFPSFQHPMHALCVCVLVRMAGAGCSAVLGSLSLPALTPLHPGRSGPAGPGLVSYPFHQALGSRRCGCSLAVVLCVLVSLLGIVVFVVFIKIYMFLGGDPHCPTHTAILALPPVLLCFKIRI